MLKEIGLADWIRVGVSLSASGDLVLAVVVVVMEGAISIIQTCIQESQNRDKLKTKVGD